MSGWKEALAEIIIKQAEETIEEGEILEKSHERNRRYGNERSGKDAQSQCPLEIRRRTEEMQGL